MSDLTDIYLAKLVQTMKAVLQSVADWLPDLRKIYLWTPFEPQVFNRRKYICRGIARGGGGSWGAVTPHGRPSFEQTTNNIQEAKMPWQYLGCKSHFWKAHFFKTCFFVKYFCHWLLSLVNMGRHPCSWLNSSARAGLHKTSWDFGDS